MVGVVTPVPYLVAVLLALAGGFALCVGARRRPGRWTIVAGRCISVVLVGDAISFVVAKILAGHSPRPQTCPSPFATRRCSSLPRLVGGAGRFS